MNEMIQWIHPVALGLLFSIAGGATINSQAISAIAPHPSPMQPGSDRLFAQGLAGQCRQLNSNIFIYRDRSFAEPIRAIATNERVILAENEVREGWIAVSSPVTGFVQARYLKACSNIDSGFPVPPPNTPRPLPPPSNPRPLPQPSSRCRQVVYAGPEGMTIRSGPSTDFPRVGGVFFGDRISIDPAATRTDAQGREWLRVTSPIVGWISNGFPSFGERNLGACS